MASRGAQPSRHSVFSTSTSALKSYEKHLKKDGDVAVELLSFSEQSELDAEKLKRKLDETSQSSQVTVLLLLTGSSSYLWFDTEHHPRNVELCSLLKKQFADRLRFVICPTSKATQEAWEAHKPQLQSIFGHFLGGNNVSLWPGFDRDVDSTSPICSLICKESAKAKMDVVQERGEKIKFLTRFPIIVMFLILIVLYSIWLRTSRARLQSRFDTSRKEKEDVLKELKALQWQYAEIQERLKTSQKEKDDLLKQSKVLQSEHVGIQQRFETSQKEKEELLKELKARQLHFAGLQKRFKTSQREKEDSLKELAAILDAEQKKNSDLHNKLKNMQALKDEYAKCIEEKEREHGGLRKEVEALKAEKEKLLEEAAKETGTSAFYAQSAKEWILGMANHSL